MNRKLLILSLSLLLGACAGPPGPAGADGPQGPAGTPGVSGDSGQNGQNGANGDAGLNGQNGLPGQAGCDVAVGTVPNLVATFTVSSPANGTHFVAGERPVFTITLHDRCGRVWDPATLGTAALYLSGPRGALVTKTATKLLNCIVDRAAADRQHHFINLKSPRFLDTAVTNLATATDGTITFTTSPITTEAAGTYTAGLHVISPDNTEQQLKLLELQIGTATVEELASGPQATSKCYDCHKGTLSGKSYQAHIEPSPFAPFGFYALDEAPIESCKLCHNNDGYSQNTILRKVHGVHRGEHMTNPGVAHPEYGLTADVSLVDFTNVAFPVLPGAEKDCTKCHTDSRWQDKPTRMACGTCHDNVDFDAGVLSPVSVRGRPGASACVTTADCTAAFSTAAVCNTTTGNCENRTHPALTDDTSCTGCHKASGTGLAPIAEAHEIPTRTRTRGLVLANVAVTGATGPTGTFLVGDVPAVSFQVKTAAGAFVTDLQTNANLSFTAIVAGPTDDQERVYDPAPATKTALTYNAGTNTYTYTWPAWPVNSFPPLNGDGGTRVNPAGSYQFYFYVAETFNVPKVGGQFRDSVGSATTVRFLTAGPVQPRQVITKEACNMCHVDLQLHGGSRSDPESCNVCHTRGAYDRTVGAKGVACTTNADCGGNAAGWETCQNVAGTNNCYITVDPTPNSSIRLPVLVHSIHYGRLRGNYSKSFGLLTGNAQWVGFNNSVAELSEVLAPVDVRNCTNCHADKGNACSATNPCGIGQTCGAAGTCVNNAWTAPSGEVCLSCHDEGPASWHVQLQTIPGTGQEACEVCHGEDAQFAVSKVHNISDPYVPPYSRVAVP